MTAYVESAWERFPDYRIDLVPCSDKGQVWAAGVLLAESTRCLVVRETEHVDRLYFPEADVRWERFESSDHHTVCPFKGRADYWSLKGVQPSRSDVQWSHLDSAGASDSEPAPLGDNVVWAYRTPFPQVAGLAGYVSFYHERLNVLLLQDWPDGSQVATRFPAWGDANDLARLMDVQPAGEGRFTGPAYGKTARDVVEGGQMLGEAIAAAGKTIPGQRVVSASMIFSKAAAFSAPVDIDVDVLRRGRTFSTVEVRIAQAGSLRSAGILLLDTGAGDLIQHTATMPSVAGPDQAVPYPDFGLSGRDLRVVDGAYGHDPDRIGPPEIYVWARFRDAPAEPYLHAALLAQSVTHWTIAAAMRPHPGISEADAHRTLSTGILQTTLDFHEKVDITDWLLYCNHAIWAGRGLAQGQGQVFTQDGRLAASYSVQATVRAFDVSPGALGKDHRDAM